MAHRPYAANQTTPTFLMEAARQAAARNNQPLYLGEFTVTFDTATRLRTYEFAKAVIDWQLELDRVVGKGGGVLASIWVFDYTPQDDTFSILPGRDDELLNKVLAANQVLTRYQSRGPAAHKQI